MTSLLRISEQVQSILGKGTLQEYAEAVKQAYGLIAKKQWYESKNDGVNEVNGSFIYTFKGLPILTDTDTDRFYIDIPSSYLELPHEEGVNFVGYEKGSDAPFVRIASGKAALFANLLSRSMGGNQTFTIEGKRMYFPIMTTIDSKVGDILLKMAIALDTVTIDENLNISSLFAGEIVDMVVDRYNQKEKEVPDTLL